MRTDPLTTPDGPQPANRESQSPAGAGTGADAHHASPPGERICPLASAGTSAPKEGLDGYPSKDEISRLADKAARRALRPVPLDLNYYLEDLKAAARLGIAKALSEGKSLRSAAENAALGEARKEARQRGCLRRKTEKWDQPASVNLVEEECELGSADLRVAQRSPARRNRRARMSDVLPRVDWTGLDQQCEEEARAIHRRLWWQRYWDTLIAGSVRDGVLPPNWVLRVSANDHAVGAEIFSNWLHFPRLEQSGVHGGKYIGRGATDCIARGVAPCSWTELHGEVETVPMTERTIGQIARELRAPIHRVDYVIRSRGIRHSGRVGLLRVFNDQAMRQIADGLARTASTPQAEALALERQA